MKAKNIFRTLAFAMLLPAGYEDYGYIIIDGPDSEDLLEFDSDKAFVSTKKEAVEQFSNGSVFGTVSISGSFANYYTATMRRDGDNLVISVESLGVGSGNMTINTFNYTYRWDNQEVGSKITLTDITIGGHSIKPLPTLVQ